MYIFREKNEIKNKIYKKILLGKVTFKQFTSELQQLGNMQFLNFIGFITFDNKNENKKNEILNYSGKNGTL